MSPLRLNETVIFPLLTQASIASLDKNRALFVDGRVCARAVKIEVSNP